MAKNGTFGDYGRPPQEAAASNDAREEPDWHGHSQHAKRMRLSGDRNEPGRAGAVQTSGGWDPDML